MSKKRKFSREFKEALLREHDETGISYWKLGKKYGIEASTIRRWRNNRNAFGTEAEGMPEEVIPVRFRPEGGVRHE